MQLADLAEAGLASPTCATRRTHAAEPDMIPRYSRPAMVAIWEPQTRFRIWFEIEAYACDALAEIGVIPKEAARTIWEKAGHVAFDVARIDAIERETKHDVIAFLTHLAEFVGPDARFVHQRLTSSDSIDTRRAARTAQKAARCARSRSHRRPPRATATPCISPRSASSPRASSGSPSKSAICSGPRCWRPRNSSRPARKAPRRCRTNAIR